MVDESILTPNGLSPNGLSANGLSPNGLSPNGLSPNGLSPNGLSPNEVHANGLSPNGLSPNGATLNGLSPNGLSPNGEPIGVAGDGPPLQGSEIIGSSWTGLLSDGTTVTIRIDDATAGTGANSDLWAYLLSAKVAGVWRPLCIDAAGNRLFAHSVAGTWNLAQGVPGGGSYDPATPEFTIACRGSAISKCLVFGYKPWTEHTDELAACVRALRADYCGDGTPYTVDGTIVNIYDAFGLQTDDAEWEPEAAWTPDGAACVSKKKHTRFWQVAHMIPTCYPRTLKPDNSCGTGFEGAAIITELKPR